jgi:hypothetical protein
MSDDRDLYKDDLYGGAYDALIPQSLRFYDRSATNLWRIRPR